MKLSKHSITCSRYGLLTAISLIAPSVTWYIIFSLLGTKYWFLFVATLLIMVFATCQVLELLVLRAWQKRLLLTLLIIQTVHVLAISYYAENDHLQPLLTTNKEVIDDATYQKFSGIRIGTIYRGGKQICLLFQDITGKRIAVKGRVDAWAAVWRVQGLAQASKAQIPRNPGGFDELALLKKHGVCDFYDFTNTAVPQNVQTSKTWLFANYACQKWLFKRLSSWLSSRDAGLLQSMVFGDTTKLERRDKLLFSQGGVAHFLALSGTHLSFFLLPLLVVTYPLKRRSRWCLLLIFFCGYLWVCGFKIGLLRAGFCYFYREEARLRFKFTHKLETLALSSIAQVLFNPLAPLQPSFYLSFWGALALLCLPDLNALQRYEKYADQRQRRWRYRKVIMHPSTWIVAFGKAFLPNLVAQILAFIFLMHQFGRVNWQAVIYTYPLGLLFAIIFPTVLLLVAVQFIGATSLLFSGLKWLVISCQFLIGVLRGVLKLANRQIIELWFAQDSKSQVMILLLFTILLFWLTYRIALIKPSICCLFLACQLLLGASYVAVVRHERPTWQIYFFDVGQGDSALIISPKRRTLLIDGGTWQQGERVLIPALNYLGISQIDNAIVTHLHADHVGGVLELASYASVKKIWLPGYATTEQAEKQIAGSDTKTKHKNLEEYVIEQQDKPLPISKSEIIELASKEGCQIGELNRRDEITVDAKTDKAIVLGPDFAKASHANDLNDTSIVLQLCIGKHKLLFTGDLTAKGEHGLMNEGFNLQSDILKVPHHGSAGSNTSAFLQAVQARLNVISVGKNNYGHPRQQVLERLQSKGAPVIRTDVAGCINLSIGAQDIQFRTWLGEENVCNMD